LISNWQLLFVLQPSEPTTTEKILEASGPVKSGPTLGELDAGMNV